MAGLAPTACRDIFFQPSFLNRVEVVSVSQALDCRDLTALDNANRDLAAALRHPINMYRARTALADTTAKFGSSQSD
jgi:hypothetical protein